MTFSIRPATPADACHLPGVERSAAQVFRTVPELAWLAEGEVLPIEAHHACMEQHACWVAVDGHDRPLGFLSAERCGRDLHILEMSVARQVQGRGLGYRLLACAVAGAREHGLSGLTLTTFCTVAWNAPFYRKAGFHIIAPSALEPHLAARLRQEAEAGFGPGTRCAMRRDVTG
ncbi:N-acetyltransferase [Komagataeibacter medellinensis]|uniref:Acetyltransferase n=2 Tax=Komagataeibacter medellinensis TaxID=1177712 RepID=G2I6V0_KOMMN|nr:GNAT family N-acetyltransferase [Komagataeibacter medellinensis]KAB8124341.1 N-acetyltransferase [Komagataeibacter medellinensis]BAK83847.1 acetyltransferase [Komagataeibacter medellinensis NBRC 3288]